MKNTTATPWIQHPRFLKILYPTLVAVAMVLLWQGAVSYFRIPAFLVPSPLVMLESLWTHLTPLLLALLFTLKITLISFLLSIVMIIASIGIVRRALASPTPTVNEAPAVYTDPEVVTTRGE